MVKVKKQSGLILKQSVVGRWNKVPLTKNKLPRHSDIIGFTLIELTVVCAIIAIFGVTAWGAYRANLNRFEAVPCMANLRNLHVALSAYLQDEGNWPQLPEGIDLGSYAEHDFWVAELEPYGMTQKSWICPTLKRTARERKISLNGPKIHYLPSIFDEFAFTPHRWTEMPWAMEVGNNHGRGILMLFSDGSIRPYSEVHESAVSAPSSNVQ